MVFVRMCSIVVKDGVRPFLSRLKTSHFLLNSKNNLLDIRRQVIKETIGERTHIIENSRKVSNLYGSGRI